SRLCASRTTMCSASASASAAGIGCLYSRPSSSSVAGRMLPSRWQWSSALGSARNSSRVIVGTSVQQVGVVGRAVARGNDAYDGTGVERRVGRQREAAAVGEGSDALHHLGGGV